MWGDPITRQQDLRPKAVGIVAQLLGHLEDLALPSRDCFVLIMLVRNAHVTIAENFQHFQLHNLSHS